jgi:dihydroxyacid dehydratase/phosphogluconate dehydratase
MLRGNYAGQYLGSGLDAWKYWDERRAGTISDKQWAGIEAGIARSYGHCMTMGTASTMTAIADAMGLTLTGPHPFLGPMPTTSACRARPGGQPSNGEEFAVWRAKHGR